MAEDSLEPLILLSTPHPTCWDYKLTLPSLSAVLKDLIPESPSLKHYNTSRMGEGGPQELFFTITLVIPREIVTIFKTLEVNPGL